MTVTKQVAIPIVVVRLKNRDKLILPKEKGDALKVQLTQVNGPIFIHIPFLNRTISTSEVAEVKDDVQIEMREVESDIEQKARQYQTEMQNTPIRERSRMLKRFCLLYARYTGKYKEKPPPDVLARAEKVQFEYYKENVMAWEVPRSEFIKAGLIEDEVQPILKKMRVTEADKEL